MRDLNIEDTDDEEEEEEEDTDSTGSLCDFIVPDDEGEEEIADDDEGEEIADDDEGEEVADDDDDEEEEELSDDEAAGVQTSPDVHTTTDIAAAAAAPPLIEIETDEEAEIRRQYTADMERQGSVLIGGVRRSMRQTKGIAPKVYMDENFVELMTEDTTAEEIQRLAEESETDDEGDEEESESEEEFVEPPVKRRKNLRQG